MEALEIEGQTDQAPLASRRLSTTQRELAETQHLFDNFDDRFDGAFASPIDRFAHRCLELVRHVYLGACVLRRRSKQRCEPLLPAQMMRSTARRNIGFDPALATCQERRRAKIASVQ